MNYVRLSDIGLYVDYQMALREKSSGRVLVPKMPANFALYRVAGTAHTLTGEPIERYRFDRWASDGEQPNITLRRIGTGAAAFWDVPQEVPA